GRRLGQRDRARLRLLERSPDLGVGEQLFGLGQDVLTVRRSRSRLWCGTAGGTHHGHENDERSEIAVHVISIGRVVARAADDADCGIPATTLPQTRAARLATLRGFGPSSRDLR